MKNKNRHLVKNVIGTLTIPVLVAVLLQGICMFNGKTMISNMTGFDNFVVYIAIVMITTIALSINLNSGRFDFSLGSMAALSSVLGAKITYSILGGGSNSALMMLILTILFGMLLGLVSGLMYVVLHLPPIITCWWIRCSRARSDSARTDGPWPSSSPNTSWKKCSSAPERGKETSCRPR